MDEEHYMEQSLRTRLKRAQADIIAVVLLVGVSLAVGLAVVALFTSQSAVISSRVDVSNALTEEQSREFISLVYHNYVLADPNDPTAGFNHTFIYKLISLSYSGRNYFLVLPLITSGSESSIHLEKQETLQLWVSADIELLLQVNDSVSYGRLSITPFDVLGSNVYLSNGLTLSGLDSVPIYKVQLMNTTPYPSAYLWVKFTALPGWEGYDFTLYSLMEVGNNYYVVEGVSTPLEVGNA